MKYVGRAAPRDRARNKSHRSVVNDVFIRVVFARARTRPVVFPVGRGFLKAGLNKIHKQAERADGRFACFSLCTRVYGARARARTPRLRSNYSTEQPETVIYSEEFTGISRSVVVANFILGVFRTGNVCTG